MVISRLAASYSTKPSPAGVDAQNQAAGIGARDQVVVRIDGERAHVRFLGAVEHGAGAVRGHAMDLALVAGGDEQIAIARKRQRPDVFRVRIVEHFGACRPASTR